MDSSLAVRVGGFLGALAFFALALVYNPPQKVEAAVVQWTIRGAAETWSPWHNGAYATEYGWHFDEGSSSFAGKDFSGGINDNAILWATMEIDSGYYWHYSLQNVGNCYVYGYPAWSTNLYSWNGVSGLDIHFLHLTQASRMPGWTGFMRWGDSAQDGIWYNVGTQAPSASACNPAPKHVHLSSSGTYVRRVNQSDETCWTDTLSLCGGSTYTRQDNTNNYCDPDGNPNGGPPNYGSFSKTGSIAGPGGSVWTGRYAYCAWQGMQRPQFYAAFEAYF